MWEFLDNLLEKAGFVAVVYAVTVGGLAIAVRYLWKKLDEKDKAIASKEAQRAELEAELRTKASEKEAAVEAVRSEETEKRSRMRAAFDEQLVQIADERRREAMVFAEKLEELQEKRVRDAHATVREVVEHIAETRTLVEKITNAMQTLERVLRS